MVIKNKFGPHYKLLLGARKIAFYNEDLLLINRNRDISRSRSQEFKNPGAGARFKTNRSLRRKMPNVPSTGVHPESLREDQLQYKIILLIFKNPDQLYGTTAESVRQVIRSGRVCVLDCSPKAISSLYNSEFMPFIVVVASPELDELIQLNKEQTNNLENLKNICEQSCKFVNENEWAKQADLLLINRNRDISLRRLLDALESLKSESQWIPLEWLQTNFQAPPQQTTKITKRK